MLYTCMMAGIALGRFWEYSTEVTLHLKKESSPLPTKCSLYSNQIKMVLTPDSVRSTAGVDVKVSVPLINDFNS